MKKKSNRGGDVRKLRARKGKRSHQTAAGTCKLQCNGLAAWLPKLQRLSDDIAGRKGAPIAIGIRASIAKGLGVGVPGEGDTRAVDLLPGKQTRIPGTSRK